MKECEILNLLKEINPVTNLTLLENVLNSTQNCFVLNPKIPAWRFVNYVQLHKCVSSRPIYSQFTRFYNNKNKFKLHRLTHMFTSIKTGNQFKSQPRNFFFFKHLSHRPPFIIRFPL